MNPLAIRNTIHIVVSTIPEVGVYAVANVNRHEMADHVLLETQAIGMVAEFRTPGRLTRYKQDA
jgi:hypothetical protein